MSQSRIVSRATIMLACLFCASAHPSASASRIPSDPPIVLAEDGRTGYAIIIAVHAHDAEKLAAQELHECCADPSVQRQNHMSI